MADDLTTPWLKLIASFKDFLTGGNPNDPAFDGLQIVTAPREVSWDDPLHGTWHTRTIANPVPAWGESFTTSDRNFDEAYYQFLSNCAPPDGDPAETDQATEAMAAASKTFRRMAALQDEADTEWAAYDTRQRANRPPAEWLSQQSYMERYGYVDELANLRAIYDGQETRFVKHANLAGGGWPLLGLARTAYDNRFYQQEVSSPTNVRQTVRTYDLDPSYPAWLADAAAGRGTHLSLSFDHTTSTEVRSTFSAEGRAGLSIGFFGLAATGGFKRETIDTTSEKFSMSISAAAFGTFTAVPGPWYSGTVVSLFENGPFVPTGPFGGGRSPFGEDGLLNLRAKTLYVAYQPTIVASFTEEDYQKVRTSWDAGGGIMIGPFLLGGTAGDTHDVESHDDTTMSISIVSKSPRPMVLAVNNLVMPGD